MAVEIAVKLDVAQFVERMNLSAKEAVNAMRRSVDKTARAARRDAVKTMAKDIGVPASKFRDAVPLVKASTQNNISASWTIKKKAMNALNVGTFTPVMSALRGSFSGSTFKLSGGGSSSLNIGKSFIIHANGGTALMIRTGKGKNAFRPVWIEMPSTGMAQDDAAPRKAWTATADNMLTATLGAEIQRALDGQTGPNPATIGGGE
jgi:hypothetical protein